MMYRTLLLSILVCFVTFQVGITDSTSGDEKSDVTPEAPIEPTIITPKPSSTSAPTNSTTITPPTTAPTTPSTTIPTKPTTPNTTTPTTTPSTTTKATPSPAPTTPTTSSPATTNGTSTVSPSTTSAPAPSPSDRKFDAFSFLGGFALGLGLVAIGFLSWKFYLSRREDYYHTL